MIVQYIFLQVFVVGCFNHVTGLYELDDTENIESSFEFHDKRFRRDIISDAKKIVDRIKHDTVSIINESGKKIDNISAYYDKNLNKNKNVDSVQEDNHLYYKSTYYKHGEGYFIDISNKSIVDAYMLKIIEHSKLSISYQKAYSLRLNFSFPFYGNLVDKVVITTGGFLNIGPSFHSFIHIVHYVAPLMANFNPSSSNDTKVYIASNSEMYVVQWTDLVLNGTENMDKKFTFQVILHKNGTIIMAYKKIPISLSSINNTTKLNVTVGFSDGFLLTFLRTVPYIRKVIYHSYVYSYHKVNLPLDSVKNDTAYKLDLLPSCIQFKSCQSCMKASLSTPFNCKWCSKINLCSDTLDWNRQKWLTNKCPMTAISSKDKCHQNPSTLPSGITNKKTQSDFRKKKVSSSNKNSTGKLIGGIVGIVLLIIIACIGVFVIYAYLHPQSKSGMWLIEHRPARMFTTFDKVPDDELL